MKLFFQGIILSTLTLSASFANNLDTPSTPRGQSSSTLEPQTPQKAKKPTNTTQTLEVVPFGFLKDDSKPLHLSN